LNWRSKWLLIEDINTWLKATRWYARMFNLVNYLVIMKFQNVRYSGGKLLLRMDLWVLRIFFISMYSPWEPHNILYVEYFLLHGFNPWWNLCEFMKSFKFGTHSNCIVKCFFLTCFGQSSYLKVVYKVHQPILVILEIFTLVIIIKN
jgi:hypothetical protein